MGLQKYPFVKLLIPFVTGIITKNTLYEKGLAIPPDGFWLSLSFVGIVAAFILHRKTEIYSRRWTQGLPICLFLFSMGGFLTQREYQKVIFTWPGQTQFYEALLLSTPKEHVKSYSCEALIIGYRSLHSSHQELQEIHKKALIYLPKEKQSKELRTGKLLYIQSQITPPRNNGNPEGFDYRNYLLRKGISGTGYATRWIQSPTQPPLYSLRPAAEAIRQKLLHIYHLAGIQDETYSILSALTLGYKEDLSKETREEFSEAGVSHLLALSGLHVGFVFLLLEFVASQVFRKVKLWCIKPIFIISALWLFAFLTGMMPPAIRATLLFSFITLARSRNGETTSPNLLAASAFLMLFFQPLSLFDISFQLSFAAVTGIILWQHSLFTLIPTSNRIMRYFWGLTTLSFTAQLATLPLTLHYFSSFPNYFLIANIAVIGLVSVIIYTAFALFLFSPFPSLLLWIGEIIKKEIQILQQTIGWVGELPGAILTQLYVPSWESGSLYLLILSGMYFFTQHAKKPKAILLMLGGFLCVITCEFIKTIQQESTLPQLIFYNGYNCPTVHLITNRRESYLWTDSTSNGYASFIRNLSLYWTKNGISSPHILSGQNDNSFPSPPGIFEKKGILHFRHKTICQIKDWEWNETNAKHPLPVDYLWICRGYYGSIKKLQSVFSIRHVILDASLPHNDREQFEEECRNLHLSCTNLHTHGAYQVY